jgi:ornithine carbamoyltransferase
MIFQKASTRTRVSFETGMTRLGGHAIYLAPSDIKLGQRETTEDIALVLSRYADLIMARVFGHDIVVDLGKYATCPVINGLSDFEHPCQILADLMTIRERKRTLKGLRAVYIGDGNNVAHSLMFGAALVGMHMTVATPPGFEPKPEVLVESQVIGRKTGAEIRALNDPTEAARVPTCCTRTCGRRWARKPKRRPARRSSRASKSTCVCSAWPSPTRSCCTACRRITAKRSSTPPPGRPTRRSSTRRRTGCTRRTR